VLMVTTATQLSLRRCNVNRQMHAIPWQRGQVSCFVIFTPLNSREPHLTTQRLHVRALMGERGSAAALSEQRGACVRARYCTGLAKAPVLPRRFAMEGDDAAEPVRVVARSTPSPFLTQQVRRFLTMLMGRFWPTWIVATKLPPMRRIWKTTSRQPSQAKSLTCRCTAFADTPGRHVC